MEKEFENIDALIAKLLAGEASPEESTRVEEWKNESADNSRLFERSRQLLNAVEANVDTDAAWRALDKKISAQPGRILPLKKNLTLLRAAAALLVFACLGILAAWFLHGQKTEGVVLMALQQPKQEKLPDGSTVFINKNSEISYEATTDGARNVSLKGEAYFEVKHDAEKPFVIHVNEVMIEDIGTAFNVKAIPGSGKVEVTVESGEVRFYTAGDKGLELKQGEKAVYDGIHFVKIEATPSENTTSYKTKLFRFSETPLKEVVAQLNSVYNTDIRVADDATGNALLSVVFNNETPEMMVSIIAETLELSVEKTGSSIVLSRKQSAQ